MRGNERSFAAAFGLAKTRYSAIWIGPAPSSTLRPSRGVARNDAGEKVSPIHRKAWGVDRRAATASRRSQSQGREGPSAARAPRLGGSARRGARQGGDGAGFPRRAQIGRAHV